MFGLFKRVFLTGSTLGGALAGTFATSRRAVPRPLPVRRVGLAADDVAGDKMGGAAVSVATASRFGAGGDSGFAVVAGALGAMYLVMVFSAGEAVALDAVAGSLVLMGNVAVEAGAGIFFSACTAASSGFSLVVKAERCRYAS